MESIIVISALGLAAYFDIKKREIPHTSVLIILLLGIYLNWREPGFIIGGMLSILGFLLLSSLITGGTLGMGMGDVKLFLAMGALLGYYGVMYFSLVVFLLTLVINLIYKARKGKLKHTLIDLKTFIISIPVSGAKDYIKAKEEVDSIPLGAYFLPGFLLFIALIHSGITNPGLKDVFAWI